MPGKLTLAILLLSVLIPTAVQADTVYTYTGNAYGAVSPGPYPYVPSDFISGSFSVATPLAANLDLTDISSQVTNLDFSDGLLSFGFSPATSNWSFSIGTDALGNIDTWFICVAGGAGGPNSFCRVQEPGAILSSNVPGGVTDTGEAFIGSFLDIGENYNRPGIWVANSAVPESSSLEQLGIGLLVLAIIRAFSAIASRPR